MRERKGQEHSESKEQAQISQTLPVPLPVPLPASNQTANVLHKRSLEGLKAAS